MGVLEIEEWFGLIVFAYYIIWQLKEPTSISGWVLTLFMEVHVL